MNCSQFEHFLNQYLDGDLKGSMKLEFETHLMNCKLCGYLYGMMEAVGEIISTPPPQEARISVDFAERVLVGLSAQKLMTTKSYKLLSRVSLAAAIGLVLAGTVIFSMSRSVLFTEKPAGPKLFASITPPVVSLKSPESVHHQEINLWLAGTLEQAGSSLWELKELRSSAMDQMRQGLFASLAGTSSRSVTDMNPPIRPAFSGSKELSPAPAANDHIEAGLELL
ncbi:MAG: zf-HC2 domain-containing protein [Phycisphaerae bacterium]